jgi:hypothetical protein
MAGEMTSMQLRFGNMAGHSGSQDVNTTSSSTASTHEEKMESEATSLNKIVMTPHLLARTERAPNRQAERDGFARLAHRTSEGKVAILNALCELALQLCRAGS